MAVGNVKTFNQIPMTTTPPKPPESGELKACPFCGGAASPPTNQGFHPNYTGRFIICTKCCASIYRSFSADGANPDPNLIKRWNTRTQLPTPQAVGTPRMDKIRQSHYKDDSEFKMALINEGNALENELSRTVVQREGYNAIISVTLSEFQKIYPEFTNTGLTGPNGFITKIHNELTTALARVAELEKANENLFKIKQNTVMENVSLKKQLSQANPPEMKTTNIDTEIVNFIMIANTSSNFRQVYDLVTKADIRLHFSEHIKPNLSKK